MTSGKSLGKGQLYIVSGPSGSGKTSLCQRALDSLEDLFFSVSYTTRPPREQEKHGVDYFFVSQEEFEDMRNRHVFLESAIVHGNSYGTGAQYVRSVLDSGKDLLLDIDVQGAQQVRRRMHDAVSVLIFPPSYEVLFTRLKNRRSDSEEVIRRRLQGARRELLRFPEYDFLIINDDFDQATRELITILKSFRYRTQRRAFWADGMLASFPEE
jgi:guanylate kinase